MNLDEGDDTDEWALAHNYVSIVPCQFDLTARAGLAQMQQGWALQLPGQAEPTSFPAAQPVEPEDYGVVNP